MLRICKCIREFNEDGMLFERVFFFKLRIFSGKYNDKEEGIGFVSWLKERDRWVSMCRKFSFVGMEFERLFVFKDKYFNLNV